jgi:lipopolysaccharide transport system ATP-binding protein
MTLVEAKRSGELTAPPAPPLAATDDVIVSFEGVSKAYQLYRRPVDRLKQQLLSRWGRHYGEEFWALRDISFEVRRGQTVGVIGRNGSGKSTLLQLIAGTLRPTSGHVQVRGRVAAMLELGSGFNPEYSGRDNVLLSGAIAGVSRVQMEERMDGIAAFADIGEFMGRPVKTYSAGMFMRLAFAVATSVEADLLLIDEVLAVGDIFFRQKCYQRLEAMREAGTAIVLVSHAMTEVEQFCRRGILLHHGAVMFAGDAVEAVKRYYLLDQGDGGIATAIGKSDTSSTAKEEPKTFVDESWPATPSVIALTGIAQVSNGWATCTGVWLCDQSGRPTHAFEQGQRASFYFEFDLSHDIEVPIGGVVIQNDKGITVHGKSSLEYDSGVPKFIGAGTRVRFHQEIALELAPGEYTFEVGLATIGADNFTRRGAMSHTELNKTIVRLCHLPSVTRFAVVSRRSAAPVQLLHHGIANLPGLCRVSLSEPQKTR